MGQEQAEQVLVTQQILSLRILRQQSIKTSCGHELCQVEDLYLEGLGDGHDGMGVGLPKKQ